MTGAWDITRKDLSLLIRDRRAVVLLLLLPLLFIAIVGMSTGQFLTAGDPVQKYKLGVIDRDQTELSKSVVAKYAAHRELDLLPYTEKAAADEALKKAELAGLIIIGNTFEAKVEELVIRDLVGDDGVTPENTPETLDVVIEVPGKLAEGDLMRYFLYGELFRGIFPTVAKKNALFRNAFRDEPTPAEELPAEVQLAENPPKKANKVYMFLVPGFTVMFVFFLINIMARSFIAERDLGTLRRLQLAPIPPVSVLIGKTLPFYLCSVLQTSMLFLCGRLLFQMPWGPEPIYLIPVILCTSAAATSLGLLLATWVRTDQQVSAYGTSLVLVLGGISGCFIPRAWLPVLMKNLSLATPHAWALQAFDAVLSPDVIDSILVVDYCLVLLGFATVFFSLGWWRFRTSVA